MKKLITFIQSDYARILWQIALAVGCIGQTIASFNKKKGDTISETFVRLPQPAKFAIVGSIFAVVAHWVWPVPNVDVDIDINIEAKTDSK
jgi:hypothetical protein